LKRWVAHARRTLARAVERPEKAGAEGGILRELVTLAWPIATGMLSETMLGLVDTKLVGGLGASALGGVGVATMLMFLNYSIVMGVMRAVKVRTAFAVGEGRPADGARYAIAGVCLSAAWGVLVWAVGRDVSGLLELLAIDGNLTPYSRDFFAAVTWGAPATCMLAALVNHRQALGDSRTPMVVGIAGNVLNAWLSFGLIYGRFGLPALGVAGSGYGTATAEWAEAAVMLFILAREVRASASRLSYRTASREILAIGLPTGLHFGAEMIAFAAFGSILGNIGGADMAAHQIAMATIRVSFLPGIAIGEASCVLVGRALGRRRLGEADGATWSAVGVAVAFMTACGLVFGLLGGVIAGGFTDDADVIRIARRLLIVAAFFQMIDACNVVLRGSLRGAADVKVTAAIGIASVWLFVPTAAFLLGKLAGWGALGGWIGFFFESLTGAVFFGLRWLKGAWRTPYAAPRRDEACPESAPVAA
jgi:MATE family multidrug resistance protein